MPSLKIIKKRITSVKSTQKITRAMKLVSAAKLRRATERAHSSRPFEAELLKAVSQTLQETEWTSTLTEKRPGKKIALVVISTDRGLAGSLNTNLFKLVLKRVMELRDQEISIIALGKKPSEFFRRRGFKVAETHTGLSKQSSYENIETISKSIRDKYVKGEYDRVEFFYSMFQSALIQKPTQYTWLPFTPEVAAVKKSFIYEPAPQELLEQLVPMLLDFRLYRAVLESIASEHGARMSAMESATKNAKDMIERLTLERNRARQAAITKELMEIISGAEALTG